MRALNARLPDDIRVTGSTRASGAFDARRAALWRRYRYTVRTGRNPDVFVDPFVWRVYNTPLCPDRMRRAATALINPAPTDLSALRKSGAQARHTEIRLLDANIVSEHELLHIDITANWFVYGMMRFLVAGLVQVGAGRLDVDDFVFRVRTQNRASFKTSAPASGLCLMQVGYASEVDPFQEPQDIVVGAREECNDGLF